MKRKYTWRTWQALHNRSHLYRFRGEPLRKQRIQGDVWLGATEDKFFRLAVNHAATKRLSQFNPFGAEAEIFRESEVKTLATYALAPYVARPSVASAW